MPNTKTRFSLTNALFAAWDMDNRTLAGYVAKASDRIAMADPDARDFARAAVKSVQANMPKYIGRVAWTKR